MAWLMLFLRCFATETMQAAGVGYSSLIACWSNETMLDVCSVPVSFMTTS